MILMKVILYKQLAFLKIILNGLPRLGDAKGVGKIALFLFLKRLLPMLFPMLVKIINQLIHRGNFVVYLLIKIFHGLMKAGAQKQFDAFGYGRRSAFDIAE